MLQKSELIESELPCKT